MNNSSFESAMAGTAEYGRGERFSPLHFMTSLMPTVYEGKLYLFASCSKAITFMRGLNTRKLDFAGLKRPNHVI